MKLLKRSWADVSLDNLSHNYALLRSKIPSSCKFLGVVKADAYGHGAVPVSHHLRELGADYLAVSNLEEAVQLRRGDIKLPILILFFGGYANISVNVAFHKKASFVVFRAFCALDTILKEFFSFSKKAYLRGRFFQKSLLSHRKCVSCVTQN